MNRRWVIVIGGLMIVFDLIVAVVTYFSGPVMGPGGHILIRWAAVKFFSLVFIPLLYLGMGLFTAIVSFLVGWAMRGDRK